ncbi:MAG: hypothetical protein QM642_01995 [Edaphocola sp.]
MTHTTENMVPDFDNKVLAVTYTKEVPFGQIFEAMGIERDADGLLVLDFDVDMDDADGEHTTRNVPVRVTEQEFVGELLDVTQTSELRRCFLEKMEEATGGEPKETNLQKVAAILGGEVDTAEDGSYSYLLLENRKHSVTIIFDGKGDKAEDIYISKKEYQLTDENIVSTIKLKNG